MAMNYQFVKRRDMRPDAPKGQMLYYAQTFCAGRTKFNDLAEFLAGHCSMSRGDVMNILDAMIFFMQKLLLKGDVVEMGELGNFRITAGSQGVADIKDFDTKLFHRPKITYVPGVMLTSIFHKVKYERGISAKEAAGNNPEEGGEESGGDDIL
ncbi:HU family DNA-binding protein [Parabacteroides pacaensis]|uniref:HU family DNA-binding protein n=1 Tax=Parabacteroides pacaensis TaxID=2086575 RepID=UPI000D113971|nr:HU family DNA-binding protein [Parabacteroides pacaensis]